MKIRQGFVSNSSSSSFVIQKKDLEESQIKAIHNHLEVGKLFKTNKNSLIEQLKEIGYDAYEFGICDSEWYYTDDSSHAWEIKETDTEISGGTHLDNFCMRTLFRLIGIDSEIVKWGDGEEYGL
jgi:hypothetical protein